MSEIEVFSSIAIGVFIAVAYPPLFRYVRKEFPPTAGLLSPWVKEILKKYGALFVFSLLTALIVLALYRNANPDAKITFWAGLAMGFGWEASVEKILFPKSSRNKTP